MTEAAGNGDLAGAKSAADDIATQAARAADLTSDPVWRVAEWVPVAGANLAAVRIASAQLSAVADEAITPLVAGRRGGDVG